MSDATTIVIGVCTVIAAVASAAAAIYANRLSKRLETMTNTQTFLELERQINEPQMLDSDSAFAKYFEVLNTRACAVPDETARDLLGLTAQDPPLRAAAVPLLKGAIAILNHVLSMIAVVSPPPAAAASAAPSAAAASAAAQGAIAVDDKSAMANARSLLDYYLRGPVLKTIQLNANNEGPLDAMGDSLYGATNAWYLRRRLCSLWICTNSGLTPAN
jgi:hypothetical protein